MRFHSLPRRRHPCARRHPPASVLQFPAPSPPHRSFSQPRCSSLTCLLTPIHPSSHPVPPRVRQPAKSPTPVMHAGIADTSYIASVGDIPVVQAKAFKNVVPNYGEGYEVVKGERPAQTEAAPKNYYPSGMLGRIFFDPRGRDHLPHILNHVSPHGSPFTRRSALCFCLGTRVFPVFFGR